MENYLETHFEIVSFITLHLNLFEGDDDFSKVLKTHSEQGTGGLYLLAEDWADEFHDKYENTIWGEDLDWKDTLDEFLTEKNKL